MFEEIKKNILSGKKVRIHGDLPSGNTIDIIFNKYNKTTQCIESKVGESLNQKDFSNLINDNATLSYEILEK